MSTHAVDLSLKLPGADAGGVDSLGGFWSRRRARSLLPRGAASA